MADEPTIQNNVDAAQAEFERRKAEREQSGGGVVQSPMDAKTLGANVHQAKMIGSQQAAAPSSMEEAAAQARMQKEAAQEMQFDAIMREKQFTEQALTEDQKKAMELQENLAGLGALGSTIQSYVEQAGADAEATQLQAEIKFELPDATPEQQATMDSVEDAYSNYLSVLQDPEATEEVKNEAQHTLYQSFVKLQEDNILSEDASNTDIITTLEQMIDADPSSITGLVAQTFADGMIDPTDMSIKSLVDAGFLSPTTTTDEAGNEVTVYNDLGGMTEDELTGILGTDWSTMSVADISKIVENKVLLEANQSSNINDQLADPNVSPALKELLNEKKAQIEASGMAQIEADAEQAAADVLAAGSVLFNGKVQSIESLLSDEGIQTVVSEYMIEVEELAEKLGKGIDELTTDDLSELELFKNNPQFANMIKNTFDMGTEAAEAFDENVAGFADIQDQVQGIVTKVRETLAEIGVTLSDESLDIFDLDPDKLHSEVPDMVENPIWKEAQSNPLVAKAMNDWSPEAKEKFKEWMKTDGANLDAFVEIMSDKTSAQAFQDYLNGSKMIDQIEKGSPTEYKDLLLVLLGGSSKGLLDSIPYAEMDSLMSPPGRFIDRLKLEGIDTTEIERLLGKAPNELKDASALRAALKAEFNGAGDMESILSSANRMAANRDKWFEGKKLSSEPAGAGATVSKATLRNDFLTKGIYVNGKFDSTAFKKLIDANDSSYLESILTSGLIPPSGFKEEDKPKSMSARIKWNSNKAKTLEGMLELSLDQRYAELNPDIANTSNSPRTQALKVTLEDPDYQHHQSKFGEYRRKEADYKKQLPKAWQDLSHSELVKKLEEHKAKRALLPIQDRGDIDWVSYYFNKYNDYREAGKKREKKMNEKMQKLYDGFAQGTKAKVDSLKRELQSTAVSEHRKRWIKEKLKYFDARANLRPSVYVD